MERRLAAPVAHTDAAEHRRLIAMRANVGLPTDGSEGMAAPLRLVSFAVADLPDATLWTGALVFVPDGGAGQQLRYSDGTNWVVPDLPQPGQILQEVVATRITNDTTTSTSFVDTGLSAAITPQFADSVIDATAIVPAAMAFRVSGTPNTRRGQFRIRNSTDAVDGPVSRLGRALVASSDVDGRSQQSTVVYMRYTVSSLSARTFVLQFSVLDAGNQIETDAGTGQVTLLLREIKQ